MQEMEKPSFIRKFMEKTAKRKTFYISDVFAVFWLLLFLLVRPTWPEVVAFFHLIAFFLLLPPVWGNWRNAFLLPPNPYTRNKVQNGARATIYLHILLATYCAFVAVRTYSRGWISFPAWW